MTKQDFSKKYSRPGVKVNVVPIPIENPTEYALELDINGWPDSIKLCGHQETEEQLMDDYEWADLSEIIDEILNDGWELTNKRLYNIEV